jgi:transposase-like protein
MTRRNKKYSKELKEEAVQEYLSGKRSQGLICKKYGYYQIVS